MYKHVKGVISIHT